MIPLIKYQDYSDPNKNTYLSGEEKGFFDMIITQMSVGGSLIGLPYLSESSDLYVEIKLSEEAPFLPEKLDLTTLEAKRQELKDIIERLHCESPLRWPLLQLLEKVESSIKNGGMAEMILYGEFLIEPKPTVVLYCGNIEKDPKPRLALEATLVHELFHAWNYCCSDSKPRTVPEIDEAFVEYVTLCFLEKMSVADNLDFGTGWWKPHFREVFDWQLDAVQRKKLGIGLIASYGFGEYIFKVDTLKEFMRVYPYVSGILPCNDPGVKTIRGLMNPFYPDNDEKKVLDLIVKVINASFMNDQPNKPGISVVDFTYPTIKNTNNTNNPIPIIYPITSPHMNPATSNLFWNIINCPNSSKESNPKCNCCEILSAQHGLPFRQVPEPWSGDLSKASFMIIGSNPALDAHAIPALKHEVFPSKDINWGGWYSQPLPYGSGFSWGPASVEDYFVNRFNGAIFPPLSLPYVNKANSTSLQYVASRGIIPQRLPNDYWGVYNEYCRVIDPTFINYSYVVTDFVHCKSGEQKGVKGATPSCIAYMSEIIKLFLTNGSPSHRILIVGRRSEEKTRLNMLSKIGAIGTPTVVASYNYKRGTLIHRYIYKAPFIYNSISAELYYTIPAPCASNHACCPVSFMGKTIKW